MGFERCHPAVNLIYFTAVIAGTVAFQHPVFLVISFLSACAYSIRRNRGKAAVFDLCLIPCTVAFAFYYSSYNHFGITVLKQNFVGNNMTLESLVYQGKLDFAKNQYGITEEKIYTCTTEEIDFSQQCIYKLEEFNYHHPDPIGYFKANHEQWKDSILICQDIFCGVVPMGAEKRAWRQRTARLCQYLAAEAAQVSRIFCGLEQRLK